jgi:hypothetical protein
MLTLETKQSEGKILPIWISVGGVFPGKYQAAGTIARISHITSNKLEHHTKVAVQKCHQSAPNEVVLVTLPQDILLMLNDRMISETNWKGHRRKQS